MNKTAGDNRPPKITNRATENKSPVNVMAMNVHVSTAQRKLSFSTSALKSQHLDATIYFNERRRRRMKKNQKEHAKRKIK
jgi:hypothetical protein